MSQRLRVGAVSYLNARPLFHRLEEFAPEADLTIDVPSALADRLKSGDMDIALVPSIEYYRGVGSGLGLEIVPGLAIAAHGPVWSVKLFSRGPLDRIERLALDEGSRTSQALTRVWLNAQYGVQPSRIEIHPLGSAPQASEADAVLLIGDRAMTASTQGFETVVDMGQAWRELTGLPFVFAVWAARADADLGRLPDSLELCLKAGLREAEAIADRYRTALNLDRETAVAYLTRILSYRLGDAEVRGLRCFARMASQLGLAPEGVDLVFRDLGTGTANAHANANARHGRQLAASR